MAHIIADRVRETTTTTGTSDFDLAGAVNASYQAFSGVLANGDTCWYCCALSSTEWEVGLGTYTSATDILVRTKIIAGSNGTSAVSFSSGTKDIFITVPAAAAQNIAGRNLVINGDMEFDQRAGGSSVATPTDNAYSSVDRFLFRTSGGGVYSVIQSTTAPTGFKNSLLCTVTTADASIASGDIYNIQHAIEGVHITELAWGTASAENVTLSFWVRSSVTGTYGGSVRNGSSNRAYPFQFTINSANTFERKIITIPGDTTGTWATDTTAGIYLTFDLGSGSTYQGTVNTWAAAAYRTATSSVQWIATLSATFYITGIKLERGSVATTLGRRSYAEEERLCLRYYEKLLGQVDTAQNGTGNAYATWFYKANKRAAPTISNGTGTTAGATVNNNATDSCQFTVSNSAIRIVNCTASAELT